MKMNGNERSRNKWLGCYALALGILMGGCIMVSEEEEGENNDHGGYVSHHSPTGAPYDTTWTGEEGGTSSSSTSTSISTSTSVGTSTSVSTSTSVGTSTGRPSAECENPDAVCGEDGVTYESSCQASRARVRVAHQGACPVPCAQDSECGAGELCVTAGVCEAVVCPVLADDDISQEVCASDGFTYKTECEARQRRLSITHQGCCVD